MDRLINRAAQLERAAMQRLMLHARQAHHADITAWAYAQSFGGSRGGILQRHTLFDWEEAAISQPPFPKAGRLLLGGAGAGRELPGLAARGHQVLAFEPVERLFREATARAQNLQNVTVIFAGYADLVTAARGARSAFGQAIAAPFDAAMMGWGSLSHLLTDGERVETLQAIRTVTPRGPLLVSFISDAMNPPGRLCFRPWMGFFVSLTEAAFQDLGRRAGYRVHRFVPTPYPHAVLLPTSGTE
jgi:hypothetical protein